MLLFLPGTLPSSWSGMFNLVHLDISGTSWQPVENTAWPPSWSNMTLLRYLDMSYPNATFNTTTWPGGMITGERLPQGHALLVQQGIQHWLASYLARLPEPMPRHIMHIL